ncbi:MAG TPA: DnaJ domain-containing protein, partial [Thermodesulfobacteriota bacterium]|nr:DnaJ domain-containing protein [Thermodesulfobacteriota bacterium]
ETCIRKSLRDMAKTYHPDRVGPEGTRYFQDIMEAYSVLSDAKKRKEYNARFSPAAENIEIKVNPQGEQVRGEAEPLIPEPLSVTRDFFTVIPSVDEMFDRMVRNFTGKKIPKGERTQELNVEIILTPDEAQRGGDVPIGVPVFYPCEFCGGSGHDWLFPCIYCQAQGVREDEEVVTIRIPPLIKDGTIFEIPLRGLGIHNFQLRVHIRIDTQY